MDPTNLRADGVTSREQKQPETETDPLTPSEVFAATVVAAWDGWPGTDDDPTASPLCRAVEQMLTFHGYRSGIKVSALGHELLARAAGILRPRDTAPAWAAISEIAAAVGLGEDASAQEVIDAVKRRIGALCPHCGRGPLVEHRSVWERFKVCRAEGCGRSSGHVLLPVHQRRPDAQDVSPFWWVVRCDIGGEPAYLAAAFRDRPLIVFTADKQSGAATFVTRKKARRQAKIWRPDARAVRVNGGAK